MDYLFLSKTMLFRGIAPVDIPLMMHCLNGYRRNYLKGAIIHHAGETLSTIGLVLSGSVCVESNNIWGSKSILDKISAGHIFAENYACLSGEPLMINIVATEATQVLFMRTDCIFAVCSNHCSFHNQLIRNILTISAQKNLSLSRKILHTGYKTIRERLFSYLSYQVTLHGSREFDIPFNRQQLADYLCVDRSALSNELSKMQREGLIRSHRNHFIILNKEIGKSISSR